MNVFLDGQEGKDSPPDKPEASVERRNFLKAGAGTMAALAAAAGILAPLRKLESGISMQDFLQDHYKRLTPELKNEGLARDIVRNVQNLRKAVGLDIEDRIRLSLVTDSAALTAAVSQCREYIAGETLAVDIVAEPLDNTLQETAVDIDGPDHAVSISLTKAS